MGRGGRRGTGWGALAGLALALAGPPAGAEEDRPLAARLQDHSGEIVVLSFWAAWCAPCRKELPMLERLQARYRDRGVVFIAASTDAAEDRRGAEQLLEQAAVTHPAWFGLSDAEMRPLGLGSSIPATAVFDRDGSRAFRLIGETKEKWLVERLEWLLGARAGKAPKELLLPPGLSAREYQER